MMCDFKTLKILPLACIDQQKNHTLFNPLVRKCSFYMRISSFQWLFFVLIKPEPMHSYPKWEYKTKNVSEVRCTFLKSKLYDNSKNYFSKIPGLGPCPLTTVSFERSIKCQKVDPHYFSILEGAHPP